MSKTMDKITHENMYLLTESLCINLFFIQNYFCIKKQIVFSYKKETKKSFSKTFTVPSTLQPVFMLLKICNHVEFKALLGYHFLQKCEKLWIKSRGG